MYSFLFEHYILQNALGKKIFCHFFLVDFYGEKNFTHLIAYYLYKTNFSMFLTRNSAWIHSRNPTGYFETL